MISKVKELYQTARNHAGFKRYFKNTSWLFGGQMFRMVIGLFVSVAVARYLGPEDFGLFNSLMFSRNYSGCFDYILALPSQER